MGRAQESPRDRIFYVNDDAELMALDLAGMAAFRRLYPHGDNYVVTADAGRPLPVRGAGVTADLVSLDELVKRLESPI